MIVRRTALTLLTLLALLALPAVAQTLSEAPASERHDKQGSPSAVSSPYQGVDDRWEYEPSSGLTDFVYEPQSAEPVPQRTQPVGASVKRIFSSVKSYFQNLNAAE